MDKEAHRKGRPFGGIALIINNNIKFQCISKLENHISVIVGNELTIHNLYLPANDTRFSTEENYDKLSAALCIPNKITSDEIFIGDCNSDPRDEGYRKNLIRSFFNNRGQYCDIDLEFYSKENPSEVYTYISKINGSHRLLDRVICSSTMKTLATCVSIDKEHRNSDHFCIMTSWRINAANPVDPVTVQTGKVSVYRTMQNKKAQESFRQKVDKHCKNLENKSLCPQQLLKKVILCLEQVAEKTFPKSRSMKKQAIAQALNLIGFNEYAKPLKQQVHVSYHEWKNSAGTSKSQAKWQNYQKARKDYTKGLQWLRQNQIQLKCDHIGINNCHSPLKPAKTCVSPPQCLNGVKDKKAQLKMWTDHYKKTLNCYVQSNYSIPPKCNSSPRNMPFKMKDLRKVVKALDPTKSYDRHIHWKYAPKSALQCLLGALNGFWVEHQDLCNDVWKVSLRPIPKSDDKNLSLIKSWRPISIGSTEAFILEKLILIQLAPKLKTRENQFAYKREHGCETALKILTTLHNNCNLFWALFLDASAAFDKVSHERIQRALESSGLTVNQINRIMTMLRNNVYCVVWFNDTGESFTQTNGIKQGGALSSILFALCYNDLIDMCQNLGPSIGLPGKCKIAIMVYADDVVIFAHSLLGVISLYCTVKSWAHDDIIFNDEKSHLIVRGTKSQKISSKIVGTVTNTLQYLGINIPYDPIANFKYLGMNMNKDQAIQSRVRAIYTASNKCCSGVTFHANKCSLAVRRILFNSYVIGSLYCISCFSEIDRRVAKAYRHALFKFWGNISQVNTRNVNGVTTRTSTLSVNAGVLSIGEVHRKQCFSLYQRMTIVNNSILNSYASYAIYNSVCL